MQLVSQATHVTYGITNSMVRDTRYRVRDTRYRDGVTRYMDGVTKLALGAHCMVKVMSGIAPCAQISTLCAKTVHLPKHSLQTRSRLDQEKSTLCTENEHM
jgi:hypothetical protein